MPITTIIYHEVASCSPGFSLLAIDVLERHSAALTFAPVMTGRCREHSIHQTLCNLHNLHELWTAHHFRIETWISHRIARGQFHLFTCSNFYQQADANHCQLNSPHRSDLSIYFRSDWKVHIVLDFIIPLLQHNNPSIVKDDRVFVDIFSTKGSGGCIDQPFQPTLKIRRLGPLVERQQDGKSFRTTDQSVEMYVF